MLRLYDTPGRGARPRSTRAFFPASSGWVCAVSCARFASRRSAGSCSPASSTSRVLGMPCLAERDAFSRLRSTVELDRAELIAAAGDRRPGRRARSGRHARGLRLHLDEGPVRISAQTGPFFQSLCPSARGGGVFYAVTDRAAVRGSLDLVVMTRRQLDEALAGEDEDDPSRDVRIVSPSRRPRRGPGARRLASQRAEASDAAKSVSCTIDRE